VTEGTRTRLAGPGLVGDTTVLPSGALRAALLEVIESLNQGIEFDMVYWGDGDLTGYREIRLLREDGTVERTP